MSLRKRPNFQNSEIAAALRTQLEAMSDDAKFITLTSYSANTDLHPDHRISFVDRHLQYIENHPDLNIDHYIANLRLMTRKP